MQPILVMPMFDPQGSMLPFLDAILPDLQSVFSTVYIGITRGQPAEQHPLPAGFTRPVLLPPGIPVGEQLRRLFSTAAADSPPEAVLHLAYIDRVSFAILTRYKDAFLSDLRALSPADLPLLYHRSETAWQTHPANYREIESMLTSAGRWLLGQSLDFAWCHLVIQAAALVELLPRVKADQIYMVAEIVLQSRQPWRTREVDWLAWEDPFIFGRDPVELKAERERSPEETLKRLGYTLPTVQLIIEHAGQNNHP